MRRPVAVAVVCASDGLVFVGRAGAMFSWLPAMAAWSVVASRC